MKKFLSLLLIFFNINSFSRDIDNNKIFWQCRKNICTAFAKEMDGRNIVILSDIDEWTKERSGADYYGNNIGSLTISCGSPCNYTTFVNFRTNEISKKAFFLVKAVDVKEKLAVYINDETQSLDVSPIFDNKQSVKLVKNLDVSDMSTITAQFRDKIIDVDGNAYPIPDFYNKF